jgi:lipopolysaccharide assembly outer membrane protein LptD (OstA)
MFRRTNPSPTLSATDYRRLTYSSYMISRLAPCFGAALVALALMQHSELARAQDAARKHLATAPVNGRRQALLSADSIQRGVSYPSIVHLSGNVEVRSTGYIVEADSADYDENSGEVHARGEVTVKPYPAATESPQE